MEAMNKKLNTVWFILAGTVVNVLLALLFIGILMLGVILLYSAVGQNAITFVPFAIIGGILIAMIVYQKLSRWVVERFGLSDKLDPLFSFKRNKKKLD